MRPRGAALRQQFGRDQGNNLGEQIRGANFQTVAEQISGANFGGADFHSIAEQIRGAKFGVGANFPDSFFGNPEQNAGANFCGPHTRT